ncbi:MAG: GGDEF domain-containing protein [Patescibacteria group bacterium]
MDHLEQIKQLQRKIRQLQEELITDELTRVLNRRGLMERIDPFINEVRYQMENPDQRRGMVIRNFSLVFVDVDKFKAINDSHGHAAGDSVLIEVAQRLRDNVRGSDIVGRYGGEEIVIGLLGANRTDAQAVAENLRQKVAESPFTHNGTGITVTASFGVAALEKNMSTSELIDVADKALYRAKEGGRNRVEIAALPAS